MAKSQPQVVAVNAVLVNEENGHQALVIDQDFPDVWKRTGRVLDSKGFSVEDQDRSRGIYFVHYLDPFNEADKEEEGILSKLAFWRDDEEKAPDEYYYIKLISDAEKTKMIILDAEETRTSSDTAKRLLSLMQEQLSK
ncbi:MAG: outer membrane protein assembly factor BamC [Gammaproteobacteria bacterium]|nr:outer membrane protein assembly factor BamC [Gammaproteobacteria bacterium]